MALEDEIGKRQMGGMDVIYFYILLFFQGSVCLFGILMFFKKLYGTPEYKKEKKVQHKKLIL